MNVFLFIEQSEVKGYFFSMCVWVSSFVFRLKGLCAGASAQDERAQREVGGEHVGRGGGVHLAFRGGAVDVQPCADVPFCGV